MTPKDTRHGDVVRVELNAEVEKNFGRAVVIGESVELVRSESTGECLLRFAAGDSYAVKGHRPAEHTHLLRLMATNKARIAWVASTSPRTGTTDTVVVQVQEFIGRRFADRMAVGVDDLFLESVRKQIPEVASVDLLKRWMHDTFVVKGAVQGRSVLIVQGATADVTKVDDRAFRILGAKWAVDVKPGEGDRLLATRLVTVRSTVDCSSPRPPLLLEGEAEFVDATFATTFKAESSLDVLVREAGSYLAIWQRYQSMETEAIARRARLFGSVPYHSCTQLDNGNWSFNIAPAFFESGRSLDDLPLDDFEIECVSLIPALLKASSQEDLLEVLDDVRPNERTPFTGSGVTTRDGSLILRPADPDARMEDAPPTSGYLVAGLRGDMVRLRRRRDAWERIRRQSCPMTHLGHLLEGQHVQMPRRKKLDPLSDAVRAKFGGKPTTKQIRAIDIALNTPDIAVIQGPPGTGKTRVLAALQARLSELEDSERLSGSVLLTGYQHTAVENAVMSASTLGLPPIKIGKKRGATAGADASSAWVRTRSEHVRASLATVTDTPVRQRLRRLRQLIVGYEGQLVGHEDPGSVLREAHECVRECASPATRDRLNDLIGVRRDRGPVSSESGASDVEDAIRLVRGLRVEPEAFRDDGPRSAHRVLTNPTVQASLSDLSIAVLEKARAWMDPDAMDFLGPLSQVRDLLLDGLSAPPRHLAVRRVDTDALAALKHAEIELAHLVETGKDGVADVLWDYLESLEGDEAEVRAALERYTLVLAATCQHAVHRNTLRAKGLGATDTAVFETVIVDEAARATPLDLLIPMSLAERRIVLVGDHRQLPHLLEPDIERELSVSVNEETAAALKNSLFQRLFLHLRSLEAKDNIQRTITLDQQFRMHPVLGDFVSRTFYGADEQFASPRPAVEFVHGLECLPAVPAVWLDVPAQHGKEATRGSSKVRTAEARAIAEWTLRIGAEKPDFTIGIIAFYLQQVREIERELERVGVGEVINGEFRFVPEWQFVARPDGERKERLRVGSVDAFQGMEFDVVFLSVTRCNDLPAETEKQRRQKYGFLMLANRLCVAMSRQHRLLIATGDRRLTELPIAASAIPGLVGFRKLCESPEGSVINA
jgi:hypothetical protein